MAATKQQGKWFGLFLAGLTAACAGMYLFSSGIGKVALVAGLVMLVASLLRFTALKPLEGAPALKSQPAVLKSIGVLVTVAGWLTVLFGLHVTASVTGRLVIALGGLAICLVGAIGILPVACNKNAIWKS
ncbi:MAG TPA: hypothetical protein VGS10_02975 [Terracidiphilus sp.]|nr:hypothetical protein [Terracidiphilus sp.]